MSEYLDNERIRSMDRGRGKILYSVVTLVVTISAYAIVDFVLTSFESASTGSPKIAFDVVLGAVGAASVVTIVIGGVEYVTATSSRKLLADLLSGALDRFARDVTGLAAAVAGPRRTSDAETWSAHLLGHPGGRALTGRQQWRAVLGFLAAAVRMRGRDLWRPACRPLDWLVTTEARLSWLIVLATAVPIIGLHRAGGWSRVWDDLEQVGVVAGFVTAAAYGWRRIRGIVPRKAGAADREPS